MFPKLSKAKIRGGIFIGPQIKEMLKSEKLERAMTQENLDHQSTSNIEERVYSKELNCFFLFSYHTS